jgi:glutamyl-tRNA reductase
MQRLMLLGLNHTTAPLEVRERVVFNEQQVRDALEQIASKFGQVEAVLLSTCNRVEFYIAREVHGHPRVDELGEFLAQFHSLRADQLKPHLYEKADRAVVEHLFSVASSLDSMVLGETQILGQVRSAYELAGEARTAGGMLNPLFQRALAAGKEVRSHTNLSDGRLSVASVAVDYASRIFDHFADKTLLCIGAGEMSRLVLKHFVELHPAKVLVCNRDPAKAESLALEFGGQAMPFESLEAGVAQADIVISSTGASRPILTRAQFEKIVKARRYKPIFLIDIAVPRDIEADVGAIQNVYLYNLDDLQKVITDTRNSRSGAVDDAQAIIRSHVEQFIAWHRSRQLGPAIDALFKRYHAMAQEELARTMQKMPNISHAEREHLEDLARRIVNKLLHDPISTLRENDGTHNDGGHKSAVPYLHALSKLFHLPEPPDEL